MNIDLHIERLVLEGIPLNAGQRPLLQSAVETELTRLVNNGGLSPSLVQGGAYAAVRGGTLQLASEGNSNTLGRQIAGAVYGGIGK